jgi:hypothetical protein
MDAIEFWRWAHILLFVFWLGADVGVFLCGSWSRREDLSVEQRMILLQASAIVDLWPRVSAALMLPVGMMLARNWNPALDGAWVAASWIVAITWLVLMFVGMRNMGKPLGAKLQQVTNVLLIALSIACFAGGWAWLQSEYSPGSWLAGKLALYGVVCLLAIAIDLMFRPVIQGFMLLPDEAQRAQANQIIRTGMNRTLVVVGALYAVLVVASWLGVAKPA